MIKAAVRDGDRLWWVCEDVKISMHTNITMGTIKEFETDEAALRFCARHLSSYAFESVELHHSEAESKETE